MNTSLLTVITASAVIGFFTPILTLLCCALAFIFINFVCDILVAIKRFVSSNKKVRMKDLKIPNTVFNLIFSLIVITAGYVLGKYVMPFEDYQFEKTITAIICSIEFISILKKAVLTTNSKAYKYISQYFKIKQPLLNNI